MVGLSLPAGRQGLYSGCQLQSIVANPPASMVARGFTHTANHLPIRGAVPIPAAVEGLKRVHRLEVQFFAFIEKEFHCLVPVIGDFTIKDGFTNGIL